MRLTSDTQIKALKLPTGKTEQRLSVQGHKGLYLQARGDSKRWIFRWERDGKTATASLGSYPIVSLSEARAAALDCHKRIAAGLPPLAKKELEPAGLTVQALFLEWKKKQLVSRKDGGESVEALFQKYVFGSIGERAAADLRRRDIAALLDEVKAAGVNRTVAMLLSAIRQMYRFAISRELLEIDPTAMLKSSDFGVRSVERDRVLSPDEIKLLAQQLTLSDDEQKLPGLARLKDTTKLGIWLQLATGCRIGELLNAHWRDVDFTTKEWRITLPDSVTKKHEQTVFLSPFSLARFQELADRTKQPGRDPGWCFKAMNTDGPVCIKSHNKQIADRQRPPAKGRMSGRSKASQALLLPGGKWTPHDLRRTAATLLGDAGISPDIIEKILNHQDENRIRRTYQRQQLLDQQKAAWHQLGSILEILNTGHGI
jgi:integrase